MKSTIESISLQTTQPQILRDFYVKVFGLKENEQRSHAPGFFLIEGGKGCNLLIMDAEGTHGSAGNKGFEIGLNVDSLEGLEEKVRMAGGSVLEERQEMGWGTAITFGDPDGHRVNAYVFRR